MRTCISRRLARAGATLGLLLSFAILTTVHAQTAAQEAPAAASDGETIAERLTVATREAPPFAMRSAEGTWEGITIDLLRQASRQLDVQFDFVDRDLDAMLTEVASGEVDAAAAAITITAGREVDLDFTHPFYSSGLGIAVPRRPAVSLFSSLGRLGSLAFLEVTLALLAVLALVGTVMWLMERGRNEQFQGSPAAGIASGLWWSAVTMTTVGYGDKAPMTVPGRILGLVWMFASIILISGFTAAIATSLTVTRLEQSITSIDDLRGRQVVTVASSTSASFLGERLVRFNSAADIDEAMSALAAGQADAVLYDLPILQYLAATSYANDVRVLPNIFAHQEYGIALAEDSQLREPLNRAILRITQAPAWAGVLSRYLGTEE